MAYIVHNIIAVGSRRSTIININESTVQNETHKHVIIQALNVTSF